MGDLSGSRSHLCLVGSLRAYVMPNRVCSVWPTRRLASRIPSQRWRDYGPWQVTVLALNPRATANRSPSACRVPSTASTRKLRRVWGWTWATISHFSWQRRTGCLSRPTSTARSRTRCLWRCDQHRGVHLGHLRQRETPHSVTGMRGASRPDVSSAGRPGRFRLARMTITRQAPAVMTPAGVS